MSRCHRSRLATGCLAALRQPLRAPIAGSVPERWGRNFKRETYQGKQGDDNYYITGAGKLDKYLRRKWGAPDTVVNTRTEIQPYVNSLLGEQLGIFATKSEGHGHAGVLKNNYHDPYVEG